MRPRSWYSWIFTTKYFLPREDSSQSPRTWRPWPLRPLFFIIFIALCILFIIVIELIVQGCAKDGCYVFGAMSTNNLSSWTYFVYKWVPTALGVGLVLLWAVPHNDVVRLEPYFQMSAEGGATAANSLFLDYPYAFGPFVPFKAGARGHCVVMLSSCILLLMSFFVTPLIAGIFDDTTMYKLVPDTAMRKNLYAGDGTSNITSAHGYQAYSHLWLNQPLPAFTDPAYALLPVVDVANINTGNETWVAETTLYEADLHCNTAVVNISHSQPAGRLVNVMLPNRGHIVLYNHSGSSDPRIADPPSFLLPWTGIALDIPLGNGKTYMFVWVRGADIPSNSSLDDTLLLGNITALFCNPYFYSQVVNVTFAASSGQILNVNRTGIQTSLSAFQGFLSTVSGYYNSDQIPPQYLDINGNPTGLGFLPSQFPDTQTQLQRYLGPCPENVPQNTQFLGVDIKCRSPVELSIMDELTGFALYNHTAQTLVDLLHPQKLAEAYKRAFRLLFALWVSGEMVDSSSATPVPIMRHVWTRDFRVNILWARGAQGGLAVLALMVAVLGTLIVRRRCELDGEPNTLAEGLRLLSMSLELSVDMENAEFHGPEPLLEVLGGDKQYMLKLMSTGGPWIQAKNQKVCVGLTSSAEDGDPEQRDETGPSDGLIGSRLPSPDQEPPKPWVEKLWQLESITGIGFAVCFGIVLMLLITAFSYAHARNGLPTAANTRSFAYKVPYTYLPLVISMGLKQIITNLGTYHSMLGPYKALNGENARSSRPLTIDYDKFPPQFQLLRALRTNNFELAALIFMIYLSSIQPVVSSSLFSPTLAEFPTKIHVQGYGDAKVNGTFSMPAQEMNYILAAQLHGGIPAPAWTTPEYYVLPFYPINSNLTRFKGPTVGIGVDIQCELVPDDRITRGCYENYTLDAGGTVPCQDHDWPNDSNLVVSVKDRCWAHTNANAMNEGLRSSSTWAWSGPGGPGGSIGDDFLPSVNCPNTFFAIWGEQPANPNSENSSDLFLEKIDVVILKCTSQDKIVEITAIVDQDYRVNSTSETYQLDSEARTAFYSTNRSDTRSLSSTFTDVVRTGIITERFCYIAPLVWFNYFMVTLEPSIVQSLTNLTHLPNTLHLVEAFEDVYRRLFAINVQLYAHDLISKGPNSTRLATGMVSRSRVSVSRLMCIISVAILLLTIVVLVKLYWFLGLKSPGRSPTTLAGVYAQLYASNVKEECKQLTGADPEERARELEKQKGIYAYGEFKSQDGRWHFGVHRVNTGPAAE